MPQNAPTISEEEAKLQASFEEQEVFSCLKKCAVDKDPRLDGYTMNFFIKCWDVLKRMSWMLSTASLKMRCSKRVQTPHILL